MTSPPVELTGEIFKRFTGQCQRVTLICDLRTDLFGVIATCCLAGLALQPERALATGIVDCRIDVKSVSPTVIYIHRESGFGEFAASGHDSMQGQSLNHPDAVVTALRRQQISKTAARAVLPIATLIVVCL